VLYTANDDFRKLLLRVNDFGSFSGQVVADKLKSLSMQTVPCGVHPGLKSGGCPTRAEPILESRAVYWDKTNGQQVPCRIS
jgi:hypothetical protein